MNTAENLQQHEITRVEEAAQKYPLIKAAYDNGEIKITRSPKYRKEIAPPGYVFYKIKFVQQQGKDKSLIYDGAYKMPIKDAEAMGDNLHIFLLKQLATQL